MNLLTVLQSHVTTCSSYYRLSHWRTFSRWFWHIMGRVVYFWSIWKNNWLSTCSFLCQ